MNNTRQVDIGEAARFLKLLDPDTDAFTFQTFDDEKKNKNGELTQILHGTLEQHASTLTKLNAHGAGIFVTINKTDLQGRKEKNITKVRKYFVDTDGTPYKPIIAAARDSGFFPSCVTESSPGNYHIYWDARSDLNGFNPTQVALSNKFGSDKSVNDLSRVMRLPGFYHQKRESGFYRNEDGPVLVRIRAANDNAIAYTPDEITQGLELTTLPQTIEPDLLLNNEVAAAFKSPPPTETAEEIARVKSMLATITADCDRSLWLNIIWSIASTGWLCAESIAREWSASAPAKFDPAAFAKDFGSYESARGIGLGTLVYHARQHGWVDVVSAEERFTGNGGDVANGRLFAGVWLNKLLFIHETGELLTFAAQGWISSPPGSADRAAKDVLVKLRGKAAEQYKVAADDPKTKRLMAHVERTSKSPNLRAMIEMAKSEPGMTRSLNEFDSNSMHLGVANGVIDLRTGALLPVTASLLVSKRCPVEHDLTAECPQFLQFLEVIQPEKDMREFMQRLAGYFMTGSVQEQKFAFLYGSGANGKSVFVELIAWLLGDYSRKIATEMLMHHQRSPQGPSPDIVALKGSRFVYANETEEGRRLAESRVKDMTGGDTLTGRVPYGKADITFQPTHKLVVVGNHRPEITDNSLGMWRRVLLVPFDVTIPEGERDPRLLEKLKAEGPGILNWVLEGLRQWQKHGLIVPKKIDMATAAYRDEMDIIGEWIADQCSTGAGCTVSKSDAYKAYHSWALNNGHHPLAQSRFTRRLGDRGYKQLPDKRTIGGLKLNNSGEFAAALRP